jgi:serine/threonine protein kinase
VVVTVGQRSLWMPVSPTSSSSASNGTAGSIPSAPTAEAAAAGGSRGDHEPATASSAGVPPPPSAPRPDPLSLSTLRQVFESTLPPLSWRERMRIAYEAWQAVHWLHTARVNTGVAIVHHDLKTSNILLDETLKALVADVGLAQHLPLGSMQTHVSTPAYFGGTEGYMDPRALDRERPRKGERNDVYSFGVVLCELFALLLGETDGEEGQPRGDEGAAEGRRRRRQEAAAALMALGRRCTSSEWEVRPTSAELLDALGLLVLNS